MGSSKYLYTIIALVLLVFCSSIVQAQTATAVNWNTNTYYQGDSGSVSVTVYNNHTYQICTKQFYGQFDWQSPGTAYVASGTPCIATGNSYTFTVYFSIPSNVSVGDHHYNLSWVDSGYLLGTVVVSSGYLYVHSAYEKVYLSTQPTVEGNINQAQNANYQSPNAQADLSSAVSYYNQATTLANQGEWQSAVSDLNQAQTEVTQAAADEQTYWQNQYTSLAPTVQSSITQGQNANYQSPTAQADLSNAVSYDNQATSYANQGQYRAAVSSLDQAQSQLAQANSAEQTYQSGGNSQSSSSSGSSNISVPSTTTTNQNSGNSSGIGLLGWLVILIIIVVVIALYLNGRNKPESNRKPSSAPSSNITKAQHDKQVSSNDKREEEEHIKTLKHRYAKGEITKKQYLKMKKELEE